MNDDNKFYDEITTEEDWEEPFSEPLDSMYEPNLQHPRYDGDLDQHELYDEGLAGAAGVSDFSNLAAERWYGRRPRPSELQ